MRKKIGMKKIILLVILLFVTIGYGLLSSNLTINGTSRINNPTWNIHWDNVQVTNGSVTGSKVTTAAHILTGNTEVEYSITLSNPGDYYEFTVDAVNSGTIDAMVGTFSNKVYQSDGTIERELPTYLGYSITYKDGLQVANNHKLSANTRETYIVKVFYKKDVDPDELPVNAENIVFKFIINYVQASSSAISRPYVYTTSTTSFGIGSSVPSTADYYDNYNSALINVSYDFFLKHFVQNNVVSKSFVGILIDDKVYYFQGGVNEITAPNKPVYEANKAELSKAFPTGANCITDSNELDYIYSSCTLPNNLSVKFSTKGYVYLDYGINNCYILDDGSSSCTMS